jgi:hypothetical protein
MTKSNFRLLLDRAIRQVQLDLNVAKLGRLYRGSHTRTNPYAEDRKRDLMQLPPLIDAESELGRYTSAVGTEAT